jgi:phage gp46-like protein
MDQGDYVLDGNGGLVAVTGQAEVLQRVLFLLTARRGAFPLLPELGSRLYQLCREKPSARGTLAAHYAAQALAGEDALEVTGAEVTELAEGRLRVRVNLQWQGEPLTAEVEV